MTRYFILIFYIAILISGCDRRPLDVDVENQVEVSVVRFEDRLFKINDGNIDVELNQLSLDFPQFIPGEINDKLKMEVLAEVSNELNVKLFEDMSSLGMSTDEIKKSVESVLSYYNYYYPTDKISEVFTYLSGLSLSLDPVMFDTTSIVVAIDKYYGKDYPIYLQTGYFKYQTEVMTREFFPVDVARYLCQSRFEPAPDFMSLLETMIYLGRIEYFIEAMNPKLSESNLLGFNQVQMDYCSNNERRVWTYLVENDLLYTKDRMKIKNYTELRPFISSMEKDSPGRMGVWYGKKIIKEYVERENVSLQQLMVEKNLLEIFNKAKYRP